MESTMRPSNDWSGKGRHAALVLHSGRRAGAKRLLDLPATVIGRFQGCDIRLNVEGIDALHCLIVQGADGLVLRDLNSKFGTFVNRERVGCVVLRDGDELVVGPFQFRVQLPKATEISPAPPEDQTRAALRIQIAAVSAQQVALDEQEAGLVVRERELLQQEQQLAIRLDEQRRQVPQVHDRPVARDEWDKDREAFAQQSAAASAELVQTRLALDKDHGKLAQERQRLAGVFQKLKLRWQRQAAEWKQRLAQHEIVFNEQKGEIERWRLDLEHRESTLKARLLRVNTDRELGSRQIGDGWTSLQDAQTLWRKRRGKERSLLRLRSIEIEQAEQKLREARRLLLKEKETWELQQAALQQELFGLNNRVLHQRNRLDEQPAVPSRGVAPAPQAAAAMPLSVPVDLRVADFERLLADVADQRAHLLDQHESMAGLHGEWQRQRDQLAGDLETLAQRLQRQEQEIHQRERNVRSDEQAVRQRESEAASLRQGLAVQLSRVQASEQTLAEERQRLLAESRDRQARQEQQLAELAELRQQWTRKRQQEMDQSQLERRDAEKLRAETLALRRQLVQRQVQIDEENRVLTEKGLALEEYSQEVFAKSPDPASPRRVERLRRRWLTSHADSLRAAKQERAALQQELACLNARSDEVARRAEHAALVERGLAEKQILLDHKEALMRAKHSRLEEELRHAETQRREAEQRAVLLKDEVERMAQALLDDAPKTLPIDRAA